MNSTMKWMVGAVALLAGVCGSAAGQEPGWQRQALGDFTSEHGETLPDFLMRVGVELDAYTHSSGAEACGAIAEQAGRYSVRLYTDGVPHGCAIHPGDVMEGYSFTGETIHSHPWQKVLTMTAAARAWSRFYRDGNEGAPTLRNDGAGGFSKADRKNGGWLVASRQLLYLNNGKTERLGRLPTDR